MQAKQKKIIEHVLQYEIEDINTYKGYKGDLIVKITTKDKPAMMAIRKFALDLDLLEVVLKHNPNTSIYEVYCVTKDEHPYTIRIDDHHEEGEHFEDVWSNTTLN